MLDSRTWVSVVLNHPPYICTCGDVDIHTVEIHLPVMDPTTNRHPKHSPRQSRHSPRIESFPYTQDVPRSPICCTRLTFPLSSMLTRVCSLHIPERPSRTPPHPTQWSQGLHALTTHKGPGCRIVQDRHLFISTTSALSEPQHITSPLSNEDGKFCRIRSQQCTMFQCRSSISK